MAAFLFSPLAPCKLLCLVLGRVRKKEQFLAAVMLVVSGSGRISKLTFYSRFPSLVSLTFPTRTSRCCSNESGNSSPHGRLNLQRSGSQLQGSIWPMCIFLASTLLSHVHGTLQEHWTTSNSSTAACPHLLTSPFPTVIYAQNMLAHFPSSTSFFPFNYFYYYFSTLSPDFLLGKCSIYHLPWVSYFTSLSQVLYLNDENNKIVLILL